MEKIKEILTRLNSWKFIVIITVLVGGTFYWYQLRPSLIYSKCNKSAFMNLGGSVSDYEIKKYDLFYKACLRNRGINE